MAEVALGTLLKVGIGASLIGTGVSAYGQIQQGKAMSEQTEYESLSQAAMSRYNAKVQEQEAAAIARETEYEQVLSAKDAGRRKSSLRAAMGASGVVSTEGTPLQILATQASEDELEMKMIGYTGQRNISRAMSQSKLDKMQAGFYEGKASRAGSYTTAGYLGAASTVFSGVGQSILTGFDAYSRKKA
jgi:hypothetical protein